MQIGIQTWGSHGDIRPMINLAAGLQSGGHSVSLVVTSVDGISYAETATALGVRLIEIASQKIATIKCRTEIGAAITAETDQVKQIQLILSNLVLPAEAEMYAAAEKLCRENEIVIGHSFHYPLQTAAEKLQRPYITVTLNPSYIPSAYIPPGNLPNLGKKANRFFWRLVKDKLNKNISPYINSLRHRNGLGDIQDLITNVWLSPLLNLIAVSKVIFTGQPDWTSTQRICGFFDKADFKNEGSIPEGLTQFLKDGPPPIYMTFGSMVLENISTQAEMARLFSQAARIVGCRAIIQASMWEACGLSSSQDVFYVKNTPHARIFPKCTAIIHHGGAGTVQAATLAGVPSIVVPHISDQFFWGRQLQRAGIAPAILPVTKLSLQTLVERIRTLLASPDITARAQAAGIAMRNEDGVGEAIRFINNRFPETFHNESA